MKKKFKITFLVIILVLSAFAIERFAFIQINTTYDPYSKIANDMKDERGILLGSQKISSINASDINGLFPEIDENEGEIDNIPKYDIDLYRINYTSIFINETVVLSGLIVVPQKDGSLRHIQYHHGTLFPYDCGNGESFTDAPSLYDGKPPQTQYAQYESRLFGNYLGSYGYLVSLPDYIGYGASDTYEHTYSVADRLAEQSVDMILATRAFCIQNNLELDEKLFLSGWSEGGAATVALQKLIETNYEDEITVTANAPLAGFFTFDFYSRFMVGLAPLVFNDWGNALDSLLWALYSINKYSDDKPLDNSNIFKFEVKNQMDVLKNRPTSVPSKVLKYRIEDRDELLSKFAKSDLSKDWTPVAPIYVHHGTKDVNVPYYFNAEPTVDAWNKRGGTVELIKYKGHDHESLDQLYLLNILEEFSQY